MFINRFGAEPTGPKCAHYMRPLGLSLHKLFWSRTHGRKGRPLCAHLGAHYAPTTSRNRFEAEPMGPKCAHNAPTRRPLGAHYVQKPFRSGTDGPKVRPLCAHYAPAISINRFGVESMGTKGARYAPIMRPLCARYVDKPFWS